MEGVLVGDIVGAGMGLVFTLGSGSMSEASGSVCLLLVVDVVLNKVSSVWRASMVLIGNVVMGEFVGGLSSVCVRRSDARVACSMALIGTMSWL